MASRLSNLARSLTEGKALPTPAGPSYSGAGLPVGTPASPAVERISQREAKRHLSSYGGDQAIDTVSSCVNAYVDAVLLAQYHFVRDGEIFLSELTEDSAPEAKQAPADLVALVEQPNPYQDWNEFISLMVIDYLLVGNFYWLKFRPLDGTDRPIALYRLSPSEVTVIPGKRDLVAGYEYKIPGRAEPVRFPADMVIHGRRPNPHNPYIGLGIISAGARMLDIELALTETQAQFFEQGAKLSGVLHTDRRVPDPVFKKLTNQFRSLYSGQQNAYKVAVLEQGLKFQSIQPTAAENEFCELSKLSFERQCRLFRVPPELIAGSGAADHSGAMQEAKRQFTTDTMAPLLKRINSIVTLGLTRPGWGYDFHLDYKYVMPREDQLRLVAGVAALPGIRVNEIRAEAGLPPLGRDELTPDGQPIGDLIINLPMPSTEQGGAPDRPLSNEAGRPPLPENTLAFPQAQPMRGSGSAPRPNGFGADAGQAQASKALEETLELIAEAKQLVAYNPARIIADIELVLIEGKALSKAERIELVQRVLNVPGPAEVVAMAAAAVKEGVRRGYSIEQMLGGYAEEAYDGVRKVVSDWCLRNASSRDDS